MEAHRRPQMGWILVMFYVLYTGCGGGAQSMANDGLFVLGKMEGCSQRARPLVAPWHWPSEVKISIVYFTLKDLSSLIYIFF